MKKSIIEQEKVAVLVNTIEPIFLNHFDRTGVFIVVLENTPLSAWVNSTCSSDRIITLKSKSKKTIVTTLDLLTKTNCNQLFKKQGIKYFIVPHRSSLSLEKWANKNNIKLIVTPLKIQKKLEDKIYFDNLLQKYNLPAPPTLPLAKLSALGKEVFPIVVQQSYSFGMFGTKFFNSIAEFLASKSKMDKLLIRRFLPGSPVGVSIFLDKDGNYFFSALRRQCFNYEKIFPKEFLGIQWLPAKLYSPALKRKIGEILKNLIVVLQKENFIGVANIDILIDEDQVYILECNPRMSSATPQIFSKSDLSTHPNPWQFYLQTFLSKKNMASGNAKLPDNKFSGALLDIDIKDKITVKKILPVGWYLLANNKIKYLGWQDKYANLKNSFYLFHELYKPGVYSDFTLCTMISNFAIFDFQTGELNQSGRILYNYFKKIFLV